MASSRSLFRDREFVALAGTAFARSQSYSTVLIALALYANVYHVSGVVAGLFGTAFAVVQLVVVLPVGRAVDVGNAKRYLLAGLLLNVCTFVAFVFVGGAVDVILVRLLHGAGASILWIAGTSVVGEISPDAERGRWLGTYNQVGAFSSLAGDLVGGYLLYAHGFTLTYVVLSGVTLAAFGLLYAFLRDDPGGQKDPESATGLETILDLLGKPVVRALVLFRVAFSVGKNSVQLFLPIYARTTFGVNPLAIGVLLAGGKLTKALLQGRVGTLIDRFGPENRWRFIVAGALCYALGTAAIPLAGPANDLLPPLVVSGFGRSLTVTGAVATLFVAFGVIGVADSLRLPASMALFVAAGEGTDSVASSMSVRSIAWKVGQVAGPVLVGAVIDLVSIRAAFLTAAGFILVATAGFVALYTLAPDDAAPRATTEPVDD